MERLTTLLISYLIPILAVITACGTMGSKKMQLCNHRYALCTSAPCIPQPGDPSKAICFCDVQEGASMSTAPCGRLMPSTDANGIQTVYSTFSYEQFSEGKKVMKCPAESPWTWCLDRRCTVDPADPNKAICICDVMRTSDDWITFGGDCDPSTCASGYWSGAVMKDFDQGNIFMARALNLDASPVQWCDAQ